MRARFLLILGCTVFFSQTAYAMDNTEPSWLDAKAKTTWKDIKEQRDASISWIDLKNLKYQEAQESHGKNPAATGVEAPKALDRYKNTILKYAQKYGVAEYVPLINAVIMQESGGRLADIMQSSTCPYNAKYPQTKNGIADVDYSIECGIHYLSDALCKANVRAPDDMERLALALQGYNFGLHYEDWAVYRYGGYSEENAKIFSGEQKQKLNWDSYGDTLYPKHVFRYYDIQKVLSADISGKISQFKSLCAAAGLPVKITEIGRGKDEQDALYEIGRSKPGAKVTNVTYPYSYHNWGIAFDACKNVAGGEYSDNSFFDEIGAIGKKIGLTWGGDFGDPVDKDHFQLQTVSPDDLIKFYSTPDNMEGMRG
jgi:hypothetical protein